VLAVAVRSDGTAYVTGYTTSASFPTTAGSYDTSYSGGGTNAFVARFSPFGTELAFSTYLGGGGILSDTQEGWDIDLDGSGNAWVIGATSTSDFPTTPNALDTTFNGRSDVFVAKLNSYGNVLQYATFLGGSEIDYGYGIVLDGDGNIYLSGSTKSEDFPATPGAFDTTFSRGSYDAFVAKLNSSGRDLLFATYIGGTNWEYGQDIAADKDGHAYLAGRTGSGNFYTTAGAWDEDLGGAADGFVLKLDLDGSDVEYATYLGGGDWDQVDGITVDDAGHAYVVGNTKSNDFPTTAGAYDDDHAGIDDDAFVTKLDLTGTALLYSTFLGGGEGDCGNSIAIDASGRAYLVGETNSENFPTTAGAFDQAHNGGFDDAFVTVLDVSGSNLEYSTFLGGGNGSGDRGNAIALDGQGNVFAVGKTHCSDFPATAGVFDEVYNGGWDGWVAKFSLGLTPVENVVSSSLTPREHLLYQNHPNPFNSVTEIRYHLPIAERVILRVYNIRGQEVATLMDADLEAGHHTVRWDASGQASGVYFCQLQAGQHVESRKMVYLR
jgi:hypothetical protein